MMGVTKTAVQTITSRCQTVPAITNSIGIMVKDLVRKALFNRNHSQISLTIAFPGVKTKATTSLSQV